MFRSATRYTLTLLLGSVFSFNCSLSAADPINGEEFFESNVRPVLIEHCYRCHAEKKQQGGLRLDSREAVLVGGDQGPAIVAGQPAKSLLIKAIRHQDDLKMPPKTPLAEKHVAALTKWVEIGAPWPKDRVAKKENNASSDHWAFKPVQLPSIPAIRNEGWVRTPIDRFILAKLEKENLPPSSAVDKRTFIRRVYYDLIGLPPKVEEVEAYLRDTSPDADAKLVDRLLDSPHYGEQWGRHWLDVARYSDTKGYVYGREERFWIHAWGYRDWIVRSLNADMPYDRFLMLQLAADQVAPEDPSSQAAMGFLTLGRRFLGVTHDIIDDRIDTVTRGVLGLTAACARCHAHKYDPIPTEDYYSLYGVFRSSAERQVPTAPLEKYKANDAFWKGLHEREQKMINETARFRRETANRARSRVTEYLEAQLELSKYPEEGFDQILGVEDLIPSTVRQWRDHLARAALKRDPVFTPWHAFAKIPADQFTVQATKVCSDLAKAPATEVLPAVAKLFQTSPRDMREVAQRYGKLLVQADTQINGRLVQLAGPLAPTLLLPTIAPSDLAQLQRVLYGEDSPCLVPNDMIVDTESHFPTPVLNELWKLQVEFDRYLINSNIENPYATILVDRAVPMTSRVFRRGNPASPTVEVPRQFFQVLAGPDRKPFEKGSGRLELARAITDPKNPLTARVMVNRVWMHHFGAGLVTTPSDFGTRADAPSHPELLDWLSSQFVNEGWSLKKLHRMMVLSATYRQSSSGSEDQMIRTRAQKIDPTNRWLWRMNPHRLSFEELRDTLFAVSGNLNANLGGKPSDAFAQPFMNRRTLYGLIDRQFPPDLLRVFDFANPDLHTPQRSETTVPQQALFFLNHPLPIERAQALIKHPAIAQAASPEEKVKQLYRLVYQRDPSPKQLQTALTLVQSTEVEAKQPITVAPTAWSYGITTYDPQAGKVNGFKKLPHFTGTAWQGSTSFPDGAFGWAQITAEGGHPGNDLTQAIVRRWTSPIDGTVQINSVLKHQEAAGDGVRASIVSSRSGLLKTATAHNKSVKMPVPAVEVKKGDTIDFVVDIFTTLNTDQHLWSPTITEVQNGKKTKLHWDAKNDFNGPPQPQLGAWEQLAQALLMSNEFCFVE